ncbi:DUF2252 domain-containing protein [Bacillus xiapuensis]|uniref:DUF2252 domain-containing protein n=1 Tax=Bacillus xiapuensis TaxID=2014075 RepID=UPI000C23FB41|nr:DUF2252 family protein [Bacillus xiapuensis]
MINLGERVQQTKRILRMGTLKKIFTEFDQEIMGLSEESRQAKYQKMSQSPFSFFRGSAYLFYYDAVNHWFPYHTPQDRPTWIQGDLHFENFGAFHNEKGKLVFDINDFDEGYVGSYLYDLLRMSVSIALVCRELAYHTGQQINVMEAFLKAYHKQMVRFQEGKDKPETFFVTKKKADGAIRKLLKKLEKRSEAHLLSKVTDYFQSERQFAASGEIRPLSDAAEAVIKHIWPAYMKTVKRIENETAFTIKDTAVKKGSGTASIGLDRFYILIEGGKREAGMDDIILEMKEVRTPVPAYFMPYHQAFWEAFSHQGQRVVMTQRAMHHQADPYLGYVTIDGRDFYVRERSPYKKKLKLEAIKSVKDMTDTVEQMGRITAKVHARADADINEGLLPYHSEEEIIKAIGEDVDGFVYYLSHWAFSYANQVEKDYACFLELTRKYRE